MKAAHKKQPEEKDYSLTPWNHEDYEVQNTKKAIKSASKPQNLFKKRNHSEAHRTFEKTQCNEKIKQRQLRSTLKHVNQQPLFAKTFNIVFESYTHRRTITTDRLKKECQQLANQVVNHFSKPKVLRLKTVAKSKTAKSVRHQIINFTQRNSEVCQSQRIPLKKQAIVRSLNNFFQSTRNKVKTKSVDNKFAKVLSSIRKNVVKEVNLQSLIRNTQYNLLNQQT